MRAKLLFQNNMWPLPGTALHKLLELCRQPRIYRITVDSLHLFQHDPPPPTGWSLTEGVSKISDSSLNMKFINSYNGCPLPVWWKASSSRQTSEDIHGLKTFAHWISYRVATVYLPKFDQTFITSNRISFIRFGRWKDVELYLEPPVVEQTKLSNSINWLFTSEVQMFLHFCSFTKIQKM